MILYNGIWLHKNSKAFELYENKEFKELDLHIKKLLAEERFLEKGGNL